MTPNRIDEVFHSIYGPDALFRDGQREAVACALQGKRVLLVQKTGWGKSLVYFLTARMLREEGRGPALIISPLLSLVNNQMVAAERFHLRAEAINSSRSADEKKRVFALLADDKVDVLFLTPEFLSNPDYVRKLQAALVGSPSMLVIDEAHCISDWGHDFRPDYQRIIKIVRNLPPDVPIIATTATANNRVIQDIREQLGEDLLILRGGLARDSLHIKVIHLDTQQERLAWIAENLNKLPGTGIIYCLTVRDCHRVSAWLRQEGYAVEPYDGGMQTEERCRLEDDFYHNRVKALAATTALGMGIDKPDVGFVIHFQKPGNLIAYYQQIGRAGRAVKDAYAILLVGREDDRINQYFIDSAFPTAQQLDEVVQVLADSEDGLMRRDILARLNMKANKVDQALKFLCIHDDVYRDKSRYYKTPKPWNPDFVHSKAITDMRYRELEEMNRYVDTKGCYMQFITGALEDPQAAPCGHCDHCRPITFLDTPLLPADVERARQFLEHTAIEITPRKMYPNGKRIPEDRRMETGCALSYYGDPGWGSLVKTDKYTRGVFTQPLVEAAVNLLLPRCREWRITAVTAVPSRRRPHLVPDFARAVAERLHIPFVSFLVKTSMAEEQKTYNNSAFQYENAASSLRVEGRPYGNILVMDDMVDSKWTLTVCAEKLKEAGAAKVYPFALADSSGGND